MQLFLSYNSADRTAVMAVQKLLQARGINTFLDRDNLVSGLAWPQALEQALRAVDGVAVLSGTEWPFRTAAALLLQLFGLCRFLRDIMADVNSAAHTTWKNERIDYGYDSSKAGECLLG